MDDRKKNPTPRASSEEKPGGIIPTQKDNEFCTLKAGNLGDRVISFGIARFFNI